MKNEFILPHGSRGIRVYHGWEGWQQTADSRQQAAGIAAEQDP